MDGEKDLFPDSYLADSLQADLVPYLRPVFFAIYPAEEDLPRVAAWRKRLYIQSSLAITLRPAQLLHVSVAACGQVGRRWQSLPDAFHEAAKHFCFPHFNVVFEATQHFGKDDRAFVAIADETTQQRIHRLRTALADAQRRVGLFASRGGYNSHLTLGYCDGLPGERRSIPPFGFRASAVELVVSDTGNSEHIPLSRWPLQ